MTRHYTRAQTARELYIEAILKAGAAGASTGELAKITKVCRGQKVTAALSKDIKAGDIVRIFPAPGRPCMLYPKGMAPVALPAKAHRNTKNRDKAPALRLKYLEVIRESGPKGMLMKELQEMFKVSNQTASQRVQGLAADRLIVGYVTGAAGKSNREKRWFTPEFEPPPMVLPKNHAGTSHRAAPTLDPKAEAIIPPNVKITVAPPFVDLRFVPTPGSWGGRIRSDEARDWAKAVA